jgi:cytochrome P450
MQASVLSAAAEQLQGSAPPSPAGPADDGAPIRMPPTLRGGRLATSLGLGTRPMGFNLRSLRQGDISTLRLLPVGALRNRPFVQTNHPDHVRSVFSAAPELVPSLTGESPLRPIMGPNSVLILNGPKHLRHRKFLLPPFHGDAIQRYAESIAEVAEREIASWPLHQPFALAPRMQALTLQVIMSGVFGIEGRPSPDTTEGRLFHITRRFLGLSTNPLWALVDLANLGSPEPRGVLKAMMKRVDRELYALIRARRAAGPDEGRRDVLSVLLAATDEDGQPLTDAELRDELITLVLAGHETTANQLAWTLERLVRTPAAYDRLREEARSGDGGAPYVEATIHEGMRVRPVIPGVGRLVRRPWQLGEYTVPEGTIVGVSIIGVHHRPDVYPDPFSFRPERFLGVKPGTYTWIPFGGGIRRCLGATLAMAEQRIVLGAIARRTDLRATTERREAARQRNVTMIPDRGGRVVMTARR